LRAATEENKKVVIVASGWDSSCVFSDWYLFLFTMGSEIWNTRALVKDYASQHSSGVPGGGGGSRGFKPPRNSEVLTKSNRIANWA
jgi:hypothetical protein